jgi:methyl-accepting chemotaxis protein
MAPPRTKRRELMPLIRPQMKIVLMVCLPMIIASLCISGVTTYFFLTSLRSRGALNSGLAKELIPIAVFILVISLLILAPTFMFVSIWVSHKILGPLSRMAREMREIGRGKLHGQFVLRPGDELAFLAESFNEMRDGLRTCVAECAQKQSDVESALSSSEDGEMETAILTAVRAEGEALARFELDPRDAAT